MSHEAPTLDLVVRDHRNRPLTEGDEIIVNVPGPIFFRIVGIRPNFDPKMPKNLVFVDVAATVTFTCQREARNLEFIRVRTAEEAGTMPFKRLVGEESSDVPVPPDVGSQLDDQLST